MIRNRRGLQERVERLRRARGDVDGQLVIVCARAEDRQGQHRRQARVDEMRDRKRTVLKPATVVLTIPPRQSTTWWRRVSCTRVNRC